MKFSKICEYKNDLETQKKYIEEAEKFIKSAVQQKRQTADYVKIQ